MALLMLYKSLTFLDYYIRLSTKGVKGNTTSVVQKKFRHKRKSWAPRDPRNSPRTFESPIRRGETLSLHYVPYLSEALNFRVLFSLLFGRWNDYGPFRIFLSLHPNFFFRKDETKRSSESCYCSVVTSKQNSSSPSHPKRVTQRKRRKKFAFLLFMCVCGFLSGTSRIFGLIWGTNCIIAMNEMRKEVFDVDVVWQKVRVRHGSHSWMVIQGHGWFENRLIHCQMNWILD